MKNQLINGVLANLPEAEFARIGPYLEPKSFKQGETLNPVSAPLAGVYFLTSGVASLLACNNGRDCLELSIVGSESTIGERAIFNNAPRLIEASMLTDGEGYRLSPARFHDEFFRFGSLHNIVLNNLEARIIATSQTALCNQTHSLEKRLLRWLLCVADRLGSETLRIKQELIADRLHVTRTSISVAATSLRRKNLIDYQRGEIAIIDRLDCEQQVCECYSIIGQSLPLALL